MQSGTPPTSDQDAPQRKLRDEDGMGIAVALFVMVLVFLGGAAYLYWWGTGKLPWG